MVSQPFFLNVIDKLPYIPNRHSNHRLLNCESSALTTNGYSWYSSQDPNSKIIKISPRVSFYLKKFIVRFRFLNFQGRSRPRVHRLSGNRDSNRIRNRRQLVRGSLLLHARHPRPRIHLRGLRNGHLGRLRPGF